MDRDAFSERSPGRLVRTVLKERRVRDGAPELVDVATWAFVPDPLPPKVDWGSLRSALFEKHGEALLALGKASGLHKGLHKRPGEAGPLLRALWMREAKLSSAVENIHTTAEDMVLAGAQRTDEPRATSLEAWKYVEALEYGVRSSLPLSRRLVREMHAVLLKGTQDGERAQPGEFRTVGVYIGDHRRGPGAATFVPPPPGEVLERCLDEFERFANQRHDEIPTLARIAIMHYQFEAIHPFRDGNGRIGRVLMSRSLVTERLLDHPIVYMSSYIYRHKRAYTELLLRVSTDGDWASWIGFMLDAIITQTHDAIARSERLIEMHERYYAALKQRKAAARLFRLVDGLFAMPVLNAEEAARALEVAKPTVYKDLALLENAGVLTERTGNQRKRDWVARDIIDIIESDDLSPATGMGATPTSSSARAQP